MPLIANPPKNRLILGLMTFGPDPATGARVTSVNEFEKVLDVFQASGYNEVDTARMYVGGKQEAFTREAHWKDRGLTLATKIQYPVNPGDNTYDKVIASAELSLKELGTDCVDILYLHAADRKTPFLETLRAIDSLHKSGKFVRFGISNFTSYEVAEIVLTCAHHNLVRPTIFQAMYNAITRSIEAELVPACRRYGLSIVVYNPLAGGLFSGKIKSKDLVPQTGRFSDEASSGLGRRYRDRYFKKSTFQALQIVEFAVDKAGLSMIETAMRWVVHHSKLNVDVTKDAKANDGVIVGVSSKEQLEENIKHFEKGPLPEDVVKALDQAWEITKADTANYWHLALEYGYDTQEVLFGKKE